MSRNAGALLTQLASLFEERNKKYKDNYKRFGHILIQMFPEGLALKTPEEFNRFALFLQVLHKQTRYAHSILEGGHPDSLDDTAVYAMLTQEFDNDCRANKKPRRKTRRSAR